MTGGVVLPGNTYWEDSFRGQELAIGIASFTKHYPLELSCLNTHTHLRPMLEAIEYHPPPSPPAANDTPRAPITMYSAQSTPSPRRRKSDGDHNGNVDSDIKVNVNRDGDGNGDSNCNGTATATATETEDGDGQQMRGSSMQLPLIGSRQKGQ